MTGRRGAIAMRRAGVAIALLGAVSWAVLAPSASAHPLLLRSYPAAGASLPRSPDEILLSFTESPDPKLSSIQVLDSSGRVVAGISRARAVPGNTGQLRLNVSRPLADGVYTVNWRAVSALDGHFAGGSFAFGVGVAHVGAVAPFGISEIKTIKRGTLKSANLLAANWRSSRIVTLSPIFKTTAAATSSPNAGWGTPKTTACLTAGCCSSTSSISRGEIFSPPRLMSSLRRPWMNK